MNTNKVTMVRLDCLHQIQTIFTKVPTKTRLPWLSSIREDGLKVPITVMPDPYEHLRYIIISGHLRALGCQLAGLNRSASNH